MLLKYACSFIDWADSKSSRISVPQGLNIQLPVSLNERLILHPSRSRPFTCESRDSSSQDEDGVGEQSAHAFSLVPVNLEVPLIGSGCRSPPSEPLSFDHPSSSPVDPIRSNAQHEINILHDEEHGVFDKHDLHGRLAFIHQLIASMEAKWGSLPRWPVKFTRDWPDVKGQGKEVVHNWFGEVRELLRNAWRAIAYLSRLLDGVSPLSIDECRIVFLEMQRLNCDLHLGVLGLELRLDLVVEQYRFINLSL